MNLNVSKHLMLESQLLDKEKQYWLSKLSGELLKSNFPYDYPTPPADGGLYEKEIHRFRVPGDLGHRLTTLANNSSHNLFMVLLAAVVGLLNKHTGDKDIIIAVPIYAQQVEGEFLNTLLAIRSQLTETMTFKELLLQVKESVVQANENVNYPLQELQHHLELPPETSDFSLFESMVLLEDIHERRYIRGINPNILFSFHQSGEDIEGTLEYNSLLYKAETGEKIILRLINFLQDVMKNLESRISDLDMLTDQERREILNDFNATTTGFPREETVNRLFRKQAGKTPDKITIVYNRHRLSYKELNKKADQLARLLEKKGAKAGSILGVMVEPSIERMIAMMAILKTGCAYLPIDSDYPTERITYMLNDCRVKLLLTQYQLTEKVRQTTFGGEIINLDVDAIFEPGDNGSINNGTPADIIYVIYTSGTSGKPKGVLINHENIVNYVTWFSNKVQLTPKDKTVLSSSFAFDLGYTSIYPAVIRGCELHLIPKETYYYVERFLNYTRDNEISYLKLTPSLFSLMVNSAGFSGEMFKKLRLVVLGGEAINLGDVEKFHQVCDHVQIMNHYGPTEATIGCIAQLIDFTCFREYIKNPLIGKPINNIRVYILDSHLKLLPVGVPGELVLSGIGLARGYLNNPPLTLEKFTISPFQFHERLYKTGDLARWAPGGKIEFLGRIDKQVKIRGFRIEPGEIESHLLKHECIKEAVVLTKDYGISGKQLCAYIVHKNREPGISELREFLAGYLPVYMLPSYFVQVERIPLTSNGKVDRNALPEPKTLLTVEHVKPRDDVESKLTAIWSEILDIEENAVGIDSNFFHLGGHSLSATLLVAKIHKKFNVKLAMAILFEKPTIREIGEYMKHANEDKHESISLVEKKNFYDVSHNQKQLWVLNRLEGNQTAYNIVNSYNFEKLNRDAFERAFQTIVRRHDILRTVFITVNGEPKQKVYNYESPKFNMEYIDLKGELHPGESIKTLSDNVTRTAFNLEKGPLFSAKLLHIEKEKYTFLMVMHHIISDGWSHRILIDEVIALYNAYTRGEKNPLAPLKIRYRDFAAWQNNQLSGESLKLHQTYWWDQFSGELPVLTLKTDFPRPRLKTFHGSGIPIEFDKEVSKGLMMINQANSAGFLMMFTAAVFTLLYRYTGQEDIIVGLPVSGRDHIDLHNQVGYYVNTLPLRTKFIGNESFEDFFRKTRKKVLKAFEHQIYPLDRLVNELDFKRDMSRSPLFDVVIEFSNFEGIAMDHQNENGLKDVSTGDFYIENPTSKYDLLFNFIQLEEELYGSLAYNTDLFEVETIRIMAERLKLLFNGIVSNPTASLDEFDLETETEKNIKNESETLAFDFE